MKFLLNKKVFQFLYFVYFEIIQTKNWRRNNGKRKPYGKIKTKKKQTKIKLILAKLAELFFELSGPDNYFFNTLTGSE